jgi:serine/threonine protein kinase
MSTTFQATFDGVILVTDVGERFTLSNDDYIGMGKDGEIFKLNDEKAVKIYFEHPIKKNLLDKLITLQGQRKSFHELVVAPTQMVRVEGQPPDKVAGFIMKYLPEAKELDSIRWKSSIPKAEEPAFDQIIANFIYDVSDALESLHANRVFMCDLKPQNILVSNLRPYLVDFDSCSMPNYPGESYTIQYLDPRIRDRVPDAIGRNEEFSALTDWWALGVIGFELFMGVSPWSGNRNDLKKDPLAFRSFNYSAVIFDEKVKPPVQLRDPKWLESKPRLKTFFKGIFSPDPSRRVPMADVLNAYFPREEVNQPTDKAKTLITTLFPNDRDLQFVRSLLDELEKNARKKYIDREKERIHLLDMMYSANDL